MDLLLDYSSDSASDASQRSKRLAKAHRKQQEFKEKFLRAARATRQLDWINRNLPTIKQDADDCANLVRAISRRYENRSHDEDGSHTVTENEEDRPIRQLSDNEQQQPADQRLAKKSSGKQAPTRSNFKRLKEATTDATIAEGKVVKKVAFANQPSDTKATSARAK